MKMARTTRGRRMALVANPRFVVREDDWPLWSGKQWWSVYDTTTGKKINFKPGVTSGWRFGTKTKAQKAADKLNKGGVVPSYENPRKVVRVKESDHVTVNVNPGKGKFGGSPYRGTFEDLTDKQQKDAYWNYKKASGVDEPFSEFVSAIADYIDWDTRTGLPWGSTEWEEYPKENPGVKNVANGPHIVGTTAYQVGVQEGERGTRKSKPTNVQIKDAIEAAYPQYKRTLQPSYVRKLASVYTRQWKAGVKDGKVTKRSNKGRRGKNPSKTQWYDAGYTFGEQERRGADVGIAIDPDQTSGRQFEFMWSRAGESTRSYSKKRAEFIKGFYDAWMHMQRGGRKKRNPESSTMTDADRLYEKFHGKGPTQTTEVRTVISSRDNLAELGQLCELDVHLMTDEKVKIKFPSSGRNVVMLASSPDGRQLYFEGGNQTVDLRQLGMSGRDWVRDNMALGVLMVVTYRTEKGFDKFELIDYFHKLGEVTGQKPVLTYDTINHLLSVSGGQYEVRPEGIVN